MFFGDEGPPQQGKSYELQSISLTFAAAIKARRTSSGDATSLIASRTSISCRRRLFWPVVHQGISCLQNGAECPLFAADRDGDRSELRFAHGAFPPTEHATQRITSRLVPVEASGGPHKTDLQTRPSRYLLSGNYLASLSTAVIIARPIPRRWRSATIATVRTTPFPFPVRSRRTAPAAGTTLWSMASTACAMLPVYG